MGTTTITVSGMHCTGCENTIATATGAVDGVRRVTPNAETGTVAISYDEKTVSEDSLRAHLADLGYPPVD